MFAVVDLPVFPLQAIRRLEAAGPQPDAPAVVTEAAGRQSRVVAVNPAGEKLLILRGMTLAQARARADQLHAYSRRPDAEAAAMDLLFAVAYSHTPRIERSGAGQLTLDLKGMRRDDWTAFGLDLIAEVRPHGLEARVGLAPFSDLALFAARTATEQQPVRWAGLEADSLARLPFHATGITDDLQALLASMGLRHLGDLLRLPRAEVSRRLGEEALALWEAASGARPRLLRISELPKRFRVSQELEYGVETLEPLLFLLRRFLDQLEAQLRSAMQCASHLTLTLQVDRAEDYASTFKLPEPTQRSELLFRILHLHLEQVRTKRAIVGVGLEVTPIDPPHRQRGLFHTALKDPWRFTDTQSQLIGLVGSGRVGRPVLADTHQPDRFHLEPVLEEVGPLTPDKSEAARTRSGAALRRYRPPLPARVWKQEGRPVRLESASHRGMITRTHGPFHQSGDWWERETAWRRTDWDVELADGTTLRLLLTREGWAIEGLYD